MGAIGRNEPCPCGSGKKYKQCCLGKEPPPRLTAVFGEVREIVAGRHFETIDEANAFLGEYFDNRNSIPQLDYLGLSPKQMALLLYSPFTGTDEIFKINADIAPDRFQRVPVVENVLLFLNRLQEQEPLKATAKGNLPLSFAREILAGMNMPERVLYLDYEIHSEEDSTHLMALRDIVILCGWVKKRVNRFSLTENGRRMIRRAFTKDDFQKLLEKFTLGLNWEIMDRYPPFPIIQYSVLFGLYLLHRRAVSEVEETEIDDLFLRAYPMALEEARRYEGPYFDATKLITGCFHLRFLERFCENFGFVTIRREPIPDRFIHRRFVQTTDLFRQYFQWRMP